MAIGSRVNEKRRLYAGDVFCQAVFATEQQWAVQYCQSSAGSVPNITCPLAGQDMAQDMCCLAENPRLVKRKWTRQYCDGYSSQMLVASSCLSFFILSQWIAFFLHEMPINTEQFQTKTESAKQIQIAGCLSSHVLSQLGSCKDCQGCGAHWIVVNVS